MIDGKTQTPQGAAVSLSELGLDPGEHNIQVGGFDLRFHAIQSLKAVDPRPSLGRDRAGVVVALDQSPDLLVGARVSPIDHPAAHSGLIPLVRRFVKFGVPGEMAVIEGPLRARWAEAIGLPHVAVEVHAKSTHPFGKRLIKLPRWVAWTTPENRWVIAEPVGGASERDETAPMDPQAWRRACEQIGAHPEVWQMGTARVLERWRTYRSSEVDA
jgi:hypothetical protein